MASHSSTLAWKIQWMEEPGRLQSMGSLRVGHDCPEVECGGGSTQASIQLGPGLPPPPHTFPTRRSSDLRK